MTGFGRILTDLNGAGVRYVLVGAIAVIRHGVVRATRDLDAIVAQDGANLDAVRSVISAWGASRPDGSSLDLGTIRAGADIHLATPHGDVDLLADRPPDLAFEGLLARSDTRMVDGVEAPIVSLADLVALKRLAGREMDLLDLKRLEEAHGELPDSPVD